MIREEYIKDGTLAYPGELLPSAPSQYRSLNHASSCPGSDYRYLSIIYLVLSI